MNNIDVSIIFVNYKTKDLTINAIKSVIEKTQDLEYEIFVVDNASNDGSIEAIEEQFPQINIIKSNINGGFGYANNLAIKQAKGKYILCLNTDTFLINNAIKIMFDFMEQEENSNVGVCGGFLVDGENNPTLSGGNFPSLTNILWKFGLRNLFPQIYLNYKIHLTANELYETKNDYYITGADIFFRKSVLDEVGIFDEKFFMYYEETDLCKRIKECGYDIRILDEAKICHLENKSIHDEDNHLMMVKTSEFIYFRKHMPHKTYLIKWLYCILYFIGLLFTTNKLNIKLLKITLRG